MHSLRFATLGRAIVILCFPIEEPGDCLKLGTSWFDVKNGAYKT